MQGSRVNNESIGPAHGKYWFWLPHSVLVLHAFLWGCGRPSAPTFCFGSIEIQIQIGFLGIYPQDPFAVDITKQDVKWRAKEEERERQPWFCGSCCWTHWTWFRCSRAQLPSFWMDPSGLHSSLIFEYCVVFGTSNGSNVGNGCSEYWKAPRRQKDVSGSDLTVKVIE